MHKCRKIAGTWYLVADLSMECFTGVHADLVNATYVFGVLYVLGMPGIMFVMLWKNKDKIMDDPEDEEMTKKYGSMYGPYEPPFWYV